MPPILQPERSLGSTGVMVPLVGYGTAPLGKQHITRDHAVLCLNHAIDLGITYIDTSPDYGSEPHVGEVMRSRRSEVFLATKVNKRSAEGAREELEQSLERLQTDHVDLIQIHAVNTWADLEQALAPDGVLTALERAREQGLTRFIGITGHTRPEILANALMRYPFDTVLSALGMADKLVSGADSFLLPVAKERNVGVIAMKVLGHGAYEKVEEALRFSLGLPEVSLAIIGMNVPGHITEIAEMAKGIEPLDEEEEAALTSSVRLVIERDAKEYKNGQSPLFWLHDTTVMGWQQRDAPVLVEY